MTRCARVELGRCKTLFRAGLPSSWGRPRRNRTAAGANAARAKALGATDVVDYTRHASPAAVADAVREMVANSTGDLDAEALDAVFVSCTSLRAYGVAADLESELGVAVVSSNLAFGWHLLRLAGINDQLEGLGRLFSLGLER